MPSRGSAPSRRRRLILWITCAGLSGLLLATPANIRTRIASGLEWSVFFPIRAVLGWGGGGLLTRLQNRRLEKELTDARLELSMLRDAGRENKSLRRMIGLRARGAVHLMPARVVGRSADWPGEVLWIEADGRPETGLAVVTPDGLVGRVSRTSGSRAMVETLWHSRVAVSVVDARSGEQGILRWDAARPGIVLIENVPLQADFRAGDAIVTSGMGEIFPKGILVGHVLAGEEDPRTQLKRIRVRPAARRGRVGEVFVLTERPPEGDASTYYPEPEPSPVSPPRIPGDGGINP